MRRIPCPLCGAGDHTPVCSKARGGVVYECVRCASCGFHFVNPEPDPTELAAVYDAAYSDRHAQIWHGLEDDLNQAVIRRLQRLGTTSVLDLGAGQGRFVRMALDAGLHASGVEGSAQNCRDAADRYGIRLRQQGVEQFLRNSGGPLEGVTMLNVLEHLANPVAVLREVARLLADSGVLIVVVPDVTLTLALGAVRRVLGFRDVYMLHSSRYTQQGFDPPIHLSSFDAAQLRRALHLSGFRVVALAQAPVIRSRDPVFQAAKRGIRAVGEALRVLTRGRVMFGYSLLAVARKAAA